MSLFGELKRRNVFRVAIAYLVAAWLLVQLADILIPMLVLPDWVSRLVVLLLLIFFIPTLIAAWALELTPEGLKLERDVDRSQSITPRTGRKLDFIIIGILVFVIGLMGLERAFLADDNDSVPVDDKVAQITKSIAVLPFADLSQDRDQEWFADGLAEEVLNALIRIPDLLVTSRTSAFAYKDTDKDVRTIANELGVAHVLEGSVRRAGDRLRVTAQLIRASDGFHLWSQNYDRNENDVISIQEDLALRIAQAMETAMDPQALAEMVRVGTHSVAAYRDYLRAITILSATYRNANWEDLLDAYELFEQARNIDPDFWAAHFRAALFWQNQLNTATRESGITGLNATEMMEKFLERIDAAIATAPNLVDRDGSTAHKAETELRLRDAVRLYRSYLTTRPNDYESWFNYLNVAQMASDKETVLAILRKLRFLGETNNEAAQVFTNDAYRAIDPSDAADYGLAAIERWPNDQALLYQTHRTLLWARRFDEARIIAQRYVSNHPDSLLVQAREACVQGNRDEVLRLMARNQQMDPNPVSANWLILMMLDEKEEATAILRQYENEDVAYRLATWLSYHKFDPTPFPSVMQVLEREGVNRPPPAKIPFTCPAES